MEFSFIGGRSPLLKMNNLIKASKGLGMIEEREFNPSSLVQIEKKVDKIRRIKVMCGVQDKRKRKKNGNTKGRKRKK